MICSTCGKRGIVLDSRISRGRRRKRYECESEHRWTLWIENATAGPKRTRLKSRKLSNEVVREILVSGLSARKIAYLLSISHMTVNKIRRGEIYADLFPEIDRILSPSASNGAGNTESVSIKRKTCARCVQWSRGCSLGIPDQPAVGQGFARECPAFSENP